MRRLSNFAQLYFVLGTDVEATIPLVDLKAQYQQIQVDVDRAIRRVIESASFIMGPDIGAFERQSAIAGSHRLAM